MKRIVIHEEAESDYPEDVDRIIQAFEALGYDVTRFQVTCLWNKYSDSVSASWMQPPASDRQIVDLLRPFFREVP